MITRNLKNLLEMNLQSHATILGCRKVQAVTGDVYYLHGAFGAFPGSRTHSFQSSANSAGISFGTGTTQPTDLDCNLENTITSGINVVLIETKPIMDNGCPAIQFTFTITNTGSDSLTISEVGYKQTVKASTYPLGTNNNDVICLLDRTVLESPLVLAAGDAGVLVYKLKTAPSVSSKNDIPLADFAFGTDEQIAAMIDGAHQGLINLQSDAGWTVGDYRFVHVNEWTDSYGTVHPEKDLKIVITSFEEYNDCGNLFQFDFKDGDGIGLKNHTGKSGAGNYGLLDIYTTNLPLMVNALDDWLKNRLISFDVECAESFNSNTIITVENNKLALRSIKELGGTGPDEGSYIPYFNSNSKRSKNVNASYSQYDTHNMFSTRTPVYTTGYFQVCMATTGEILGTALSYGDATVVKTLYPFGCL